MASLLLGIDPGFAALGLARVELLAAGERVLNLAVIRTEASAQKREVRASDDNLRRARELAAALDAQVTPEVVALAVEAQSWPRNAGSRPRCTFLVSPPSSSEKKSSPSSPRAPWPLKAR